MPRLTWATYSTSVKNPTAATTTPAILATSLARGPDRREASVRAASPAATNPIAEFAFTASEPGMPERRSGRSSAQPTRMASPRNAAASAAERASISRFRGSRRVSTDMGGAARSPVRGKSMLTPWPAGRKGTERAGPPNGPGWGPCYPGSQRTP